MALDGWVTMSGHLYKYIINYFILCLVNLGSAIEAESSSTVIL